MATKKRIEQRGSTGKKRSGETACSVRLKRPGEKASTYGARGRASTNPVLKACSAAWKRIKDSVK